MYTLVAVALVISLMITAAPPTAEAATNDAVLAEWDRVATPTTEGWVLAPESMIHSFATAAPGEVAYAIVYTYFRPDDPAKEWAPWYLVKSTDHAATWKDITEGVDKEVRKVTKITDDLAPSPDYAMSKVACGPDDTDFVAIVITIVHGTYGGTYVFISIDGGMTFKSTGIVDPTVSAWDVYDFAVSPEVDDVRDIAIAGSFGIWRSQATGALATTWDDATSYLGWDDDSVIWSSDVVIAVHFAPSWGSDQTILVVTANNTSAYLQSGVWDADGDGAWNVEANFKPAVKLQDVLRNAVPTSIPYNLLRKATASITTPMDYSGRQFNQRYAWVHLNYYAANGNGGVPEGKIFRIRDGSVTAVLSQIPDSPWLTNVHYVGNIASGKAIAGLLGDGTGSVTDPCKGVQVYRHSNIVEMDICCGGWLESCKPPTGSWVMAAFYVSEDKAYAVGLYDGYHWYDEGAWSWSFDDGQTWNQLSLIDTRIDYLSDVAVSPDCNKTMVVGINDYGCDSVWYHAEDLSHYGFDEYNGKWQRTWSGMLEYGHGLLRLNPEEDNGETVYLVDRMNDKIYYNSMQTLGCWEPGRAKVSQIVDLAVKNESTIYALGYNGKVTVSDDYGVYQSFSKPVDSEVEHGWTIALWGDEVLVGGQNGEVAHSPHGTDNFTELTEETRARLPIGGYVTVAFDSYYGENDTIYVATADEYAGYYNWTTRGGVYRWVAGESTEWYDLGAKEEYAYTGLVLDNPDGNPKTTPATGGVLYASYYHIPDYGYWYYMGQHTGVGRLLAPAWDFCCDETDWDYLYEGLTFPGDSYYGTSERFQATPHALKICGCLTPDSYTKIFAIDSYQSYDIHGGKSDGPYKTGNVWRFIDCYSKSSPDLRAPTDGYIAQADLCDCVNLPFNLAWDRMCDACNYQIQFALDPDFTQIHYVDQELFPEPVDWSGIWQPGTVEVRPIPAVNPSISVPQKFLPGVTYYWRVRSVMAESGQTIRSWWSTPRSFTVAPRAGDGVYLVSPANDATIARTNIAFTWGSNMAVDSYKFELSPNADFSGTLTDSKTGLTITAYKYTGTALAYDTPYFWRVTAIKDGAPISIAIGSFRTVAETPPAPVVPEPVTPFWVWVVIAIGAVLVIVVIVLIFRTRRV